MLFQPVVQRFVHQFTEPAVLQYPLVDTLPRGHSVLTEPLMFTLLICILLQMVFNPSCNDSSIYSLNLPSCNTLSETHDHVYPPHTQSP